MQSALYYALEAVIAVVVIATLALIVKARKGGGR